MSHGVARALATTALGLALVLAAATFDTPSLYAPGIGLAGLAIAATLWVRLAARGASVTRAPGPPTVVEEEVYPLRLLVGAGLLPLPGGELHEPLLAFPVPVGGRWSKRVRVEVRFSRRGRHRLEPAVLAIRDPLGIHELEVRGEDGGDLVVLPRVEPVEARGVGGGPGESARPGGDGRPAGLRLDGSVAELELDGLRPYRMGSPASRIAWPAVARTGEMLERRLAADADSAPLVVLDPSRPTSEEDLDKAVRAAASLCFHLARAGGCAILLPEDRRPIEVGPDLGTWPRVHARLALVGPQGGPPSSLAARGRVVFWVSSAGGRLPRALQRVGATARYLVTPSPSPLYRTLFTVAGCSAQRVDRVRRSAPARTAA